MLYEMTCGCRITADERLRIKGTYRCPCEKAGRQAFYVFTCECDVEVKAKNSNTKNLKTRYSERIRKMIEKISKMKETSMNNRARVKRWRSVNPGSSVAACARALNLRWQTVKQHIVAIEIGG